MKRTYTYALAIAATVTWSQSPALAQNQGFEKKTFNYSEWTKGRFAEAVTVVNPENGFPWWHRS